MESNIKAMPRKTGDPSRTEGEPMDFATMFQSSVKEGIGNTLGPVVMGTLENLLKQPLKTYAERPSELHRDLTRIFGSAGITLEKMIAKDLYQRLDLRYSGELDFETSISLAGRNMMLKQRRNN